MRRRREQKRQRIVQIFLGLFVVSIMIMSSFQLWVNNQQEQVSYSDYHFRVDPQSRMYILDLDGREYDFHSFPSSVDFVNVSPEISPMLRNSQIIVFTMDPEAGNLQNIEQARYDMSRYVEKGLLAVTQNNTEYSAFPIYGCEDAKQYVPVVYFNVAENASIELVGNCVVVNANNTDVFMMRDRLLYSYLGVIEDG